MSRKSSHNWVYGYGLASDLASALFWVLVLLRALSGRLDAKKLALIGLVIPCYRRSVAFVADAEATCVGGLNCRADRPLAIGVGQHAHVGDSPTLPLPSIILYRWLFVDSCFAAKVPPQNIFTSIDRTWKKKSQFRTSWSYYFSILPSSSLQEATSTRLRYSCQCIFYGNIE